MSISQDCIDDLMKQFDVEECVYLIAYVDTKPKDRQILHVVDNIKNHSHDLEAEGKNGFKTMLDDIAGCFKRERLM